MFYSLNHVCRHDTGQEDKGLISHSTECLIITKQFLNGNNFSKYAFITYAKEVMFSTLFVCMSGKSISPKGKDRFWQFFCISEQSWAKNQWIRFKWLSGSSDQVIQISIRMLWRQLYGVWFFCSTGYSS